MPRFQITLVNDEFVATDEVEVVDIEAARAMALKSALQLGSGQVQGGSPVFGAEVTLEGAETPERFILTIAKSPLL